MIRSKRIIANSIKDHLIPQVSSKDTPREMFDALSRMYEGRNINRRWTWEPNSKVQKWGRVNLSMNTSQGSQLKEQLEAIEDKIDEIGLVMTALNGLTRPRDSFI